MEGQGRVLIGKGGRMQGWKEEDNNNNNNKGLDKAARRIAKGADVILGEREWNGKEREKKRVEVGKKKKKKKKKRKRCRDVEGRKGAEWHIALRNAEAMSRKELGCDA